jgi:hypothetical protein
MMHAAMGLYADDVDDTSRCSDRWRGQINTLEKISKQNNPAHDGESLCSQEFIQVNYAPTFISLLRLTWKVIRCTDCTHINNNSF